jgi:hypothetical protein
LLCAAQQVLKPLRCITRKLPEILNKMRLVEKIILVADFCQRLYPDRAFSFIDELYGFNDERVCLDIFKLG